MAVHLFVLFPEVVSKGLTCSSNYRFFNIFTSHICFCV